jgi:hypothetical protein
MVFSQGLHEQDSGLLCEGLLGMSGGCRWAKLAQEAVRAMAWWNLAVAAELLTGDA